MEKRDFDYDLPAERIAQRPLARRSASRLLHLERDSGACHDRRVTDLVDLLAPGDLLVFNDTRVLAARLFGRKASGGRAEVMLERVLDSTTISAKIRANKPPRTDTRIAIGDFELQVIARSGELYTLALAQGTDVAALLDTHGHMPLPPYIRREDSAADRRRYQTVWARRDGAVAAPTAGLHFDHALLDELAARRIGFDYVTLHVGAGTYQRLREGDVREQRLHAERVAVGPALCERIARTRTEGGRVVAVGTTVVRSLESAARQNADGRIAPFAGETALFIKPGDPFHVVDAMVTNFHEPQSSLLMLVCAFAGHERVLAAYAHALADGGYRFLSYGDAMFIG